MSEGKFSQIGDVCETCRFDRRKVKGGGLSVRVEEAVTERGDVVQVGVVDVEALSD